MKNLLSLTLFLCFSLTLVAQTRKPVGKVDEVLKVYQKLSLPYLKELAKKEFGYGTDENTIVSVTARYTALKARAETKISEDVTLACDKNQVGENVNEISVLTQTAYRTEFTGLPKEFYDKVNAEIKML